MRSGTSILAYLQDLLGEDFSISLFLSIVRKSLIWILLLVMLALAIVFFYLRYTLPEYAASSTLMLKREQTVKHKLFGTSDLLAGDLDEVSLEIQLISSKYFIKRVISDLDFDISYFKEGRTKFVSSELYSSSPFTVEVKNINDPNVFGKDIYLEMLNRKSFILKYSFNNQNYREILSFNKFFETPYCEIKVSLNKDGYTRIQEYVGHSYFFRLNDLDEYAELLSSKINVVPLNPQTKTIKIEYTDKNKNKARELVNQLADEFVIYDIERQAESADKILGFLNNEIESFTVDLQQYEDTLKQYRLENRYLDPQTEMNSLIQSLRNLEGSKVDHMLELKVIDWFYDYMGNLTDLRKISSGLMGRELDAINKYITQIKALDQEREKLLLNVSTEHPSVKLIEESIIRVKNDMLNDLDNIVIQKKYKLESINEQYVKNLQRLLILPEEEQKFSRLQNTYNRMNNYYQMLIDTRTDYSVAKAGMISDYIILKKASTPNKPIGPEATFLWLIAVAVALGVGFILIAIQYLLHDKIISIDTIQKHTKASVLGVVPTVQTDIPGSSIVVSQNPKSIISETFRTLRSNLQFISNAPGPKTLAITSTISGEGKTFIAINFGAIISMLEKKVIILDVDMRRPRLSKIFSVPNNIGMSTILIGKDNYSDCIFNTELKNLDFITSGPIPPNPAELILSKRLQELIEELKTKYDYIIFDTPPLGLVTDGFEIIKNVDYPIYIFRADYSSKSFINNVNKLVDENKVENLSVILNDLGRGVSGYHYGGYSYGYGYGYGYAYGHSGYYSETLEVKKPLLKRLFSRSGKE